MVNPMLTKFGLGAVLLVALLCDFHAWAQGSWDVLAFGGKGELHAPPVCGQLAAFSGSPLRFDLDRDLYGAQERDLTRSVHRRVLDATPSRGVYEIVQRVRSRDVWIHGLKVQDSSLVLTMKQLLVERGPGEFCEVYLIEHEDSVQLPWGGMHTSGVVRIEGQRVLKSIDQDHRTASTVYWLLPKNGAPLRLNTDAVSIAASRGNPQGEWVYDNMLDLTGDGFSVCPARQAEAAGKGGVLLTLGIEGDRAVVRKEEPAGEACGK
jgi:hypothetical protein